MEQNQKNQNNNQQRQKQSNQNTRIRQENSRPLERNKRFSHSRNSNTGDNYTANAQQGNREKPLNKDRLKGRDSRYATKSREQKLSEKTNPDVKQAVKSNQNKTYKYDSGFASGGNTRYGRNDSRNSIHNEILGRSITSKRIETVEDIQADIERIDKDIQFEIKQIKAVKLGL